VESTVCEWENGRCVPRLAKLVNISACFGVSLDSILCGRPAYGNELEALVCATQEPAAAQSGSNYMSAGKLLRLFQTLPDRDKERLAGYLDALCRENAPPLSPAGDLPPASKGNRGRAANL
jgi:transcriptional regulator with XRE-family HTH domain